jgi:hypothetical protein
MHINLTGLHMLFYFPNYKLIYDVYRYILQQSAFLMYIYTLKRNNYEIFNRH